jgi:hypothetical protein
MKPSQDSMNRCSSARIPKIDHRSRQLLSVAVAKTKRLAAN